MNLEYKGMQRYNTDVKISGNNVSIRIYEDMQLKGYLVDERKGSLESIESLSLFISNMEESPLKQEYKATMAMIELNDEIIKKDRWKRTNRKAKQKLIDLVSCNAGKWKDCEGNKQYVRFMTLTFKKNNKSTRDLKYCNGELNKFFKKIGYKYYDISGNVFKYITVPELQKRGVWHYHVIIFNSKYLPQSELLKMWGHGSVHIEVIKEDSAGLVASYVVKYMSKNINTKTGEIKEDSSAEYEKYFEYNLQDMKRYNPSRGLIQPDKFSSTYTEKEIKSGVEFLEKSDSLESLDDVGKTIDIQVVTSEERGRIIYCSFRINDKKILDKYVNSLKVKAYERMQNISEKSTNYKKARRIIEKMSDDGVDVYKQLFKCFDDEVRFKLKSGKIKYYSKKLEHSNGRKKIRLV